MTRSFNRGATASGSRLRAIENIQEDSEYSPLPSKLVSRVQLFSTMGSRYPLLGDAEINKVENAFNKIFAPVFSGYRNHLI
jgi:hypothetical protein